MVDIRRPVCGILVGGSPAPGINGVISAVVIQCIEWNLVPIGFRRGFKYLKQGLTNHYMSLTAADVTRMHDRGGSILATSKEQLVTEEDISNVIDALKHLKVRYLITIGGTATAFSAHKLATALRDRHFDVVHAPNLMNPLSAGKFYQHFTQNSHNSNISNNSNNNNYDSDASSNNSDNSDNDNNNNSNNNNGNNNNNTTSNTKANESMMSMLQHQTHSARIPNRNVIDLDNPNILITHVPKTIFNDLPLPDNCYTFGFSTARELGVKIVSNLSVDAKTMHRWYIVTVIGARTGHLALGIGKAAASTITLIPEQFRHRQNAATKHNKPASYDYGIVKPTTTNAHNSSQLNSSSSLYINQNGNSNNFFFSNNNVAPRLSQCDKNNINKDESPEVIVNFEDDSPQNGENKTSMATMAPNNNNNNNNNSNDLDSDDNSEEKMDRPAKSSMIGSGQRTHNGPSGLRPIAIKPAQPSIGSVSNASSYTNTGSAAGGAERTPLGYANDSPYYTQISDRYGAIPPQMTDQLIKSQIDNEATMEINKNNQTLKLKEIVDIIDASMIKRLSDSKDYGVAVITEGLVDMLDKTDLNKYFEGNVDRGHELLNYQIKRKLAKRWAKRKNEMYLRTKFLGFELRSDDPNAHDIILSRDLGYAAVFSCKVKNINATIVAIKGGELVSIPLSEMMDPETKSPTVKGVNIESLTYTVAQSYMIKLTKADLKDSKRLKKMADIAGMDTETFRKTYSYIAA